jgi:hypothetical protein
MKTNLIAFLIVIALALGFSWIVTCGVIFLVTLCFGWTFNWLMATGIWLCLLLVSAFVKGGSKE